MKRKKKSGMTLIEVVAAIAILAGGVTVAYSAFTFSHKTWASEKVNVELVSINQSISQGLKAKGKSQVKNITGVGSNVFIFSDDYKEISKAVIAPDVKALTSTYIMKPTAQSNYEGCTLANTKPHKYGALLQIEESKLKTSGYKDYFFYKVNLTVWNLSLSTEIKSQTTFYIGR